MIDKKEPINDKLLLAEYLVESNGGDKKLAKIEHDFFLRCLNIQHSASFGIGGYGYRGRAKKNYLDAIENMVDLAIQETQAAGYILGEMVSIKKSDIADCYYNFTIRYLKQKGKTTKRNHVDSMTVFAKTEDEARGQLSVKLKKLNETLLEIEKINKKMKFVVLKNDKWIDIDNISVIT